MSELNLCEILKGHEGAVFYSRSFGSVTLVRVNVDELYFDSNSEIRNELLVDQYGYVSEYGERDIFPSKDQRDWNKWVIENQKNKAPKTWSEMIKGDKLCCGYDFCIDITGHDAHGWTRRNTPIEKSALALLKIHQLIEVGYGGNVKNRDRINFYTIQWSYECNRFIIRNFGPFLEDCGTPLCFHTKEQAIEFLSYPDNIQLLKDYFTV